MNKLKVGFFLAFRQIKNSSKWVNILIIFIMTATFLNLVFVSGILEGLVTGSSNDLRNNYSGEIIIIPEEKKINIINTAEIVRAIEEKPEIEYFTVRRLSGAIMEKNTGGINKPNVEENSVNVTLSGINFTKEKETTNLKNFLVEGNYPDDSSRREILIGSGFLDEYDSAISDQSLKGVKVGERVKLTAGGNSREYIVSGILKAKISQINSRVFINEKEFISLTGISPGTSNEISIRTDESNVSLVSSYLEKYSEKSDAKVETWKENQGQFFTDLSKTFSLLGSFIGAIGLTVASITLFIVFFINAILREKYIGILKGIGINSGTIKCSYVIQSIFYALIGSTIGFLILFLLLVPYFSRNPIDFPFSDGILDVTYFGTFLRLIILLISSFAAGYFPAYLVTRKNTIDSILGR